MPRKKSLLDGSIENQLAQADNLLSKLLKKSRGSIATVYIPPIPVMSSNFNRDTGIAINAVIPAKGIITDIAMFVELADNVKSTEFEASLKQSRIVNNIVFTIKHILTMDKLNIPVEPGNLFTIRALRPDDVKDVSASALYQIAPDRGEIQKQLLDEIDKLTIEVTE